MRVNLKVMVAEQQQHTGLCSPRVQFCFNCVARTVECYIFKSATVLCNNNNNMRTYNERVVEKIECEVRAVTRWREVMSCLVFIDQVKQVRFKVRFKCGEGR